MTTVSLLLVGCGGGGGSGAGPAVGGGANPTFGIDTRPSLATFSLPAEGGGAGSYALEDSFPNLPTFENPILVLGVPRPDSRLLVVEQIGRIRVFSPSAAVASTDVILDVSALIACCWERGLLGFAFDPAFNTNHYIYIHYTRSGDGAIVIERYTWNPAAASATGRKTILTVDHSGSSSHNGGMLAFGPDGNLYIALGDGGGAEDPFDNSQNLGSLLGKVLRIDVHPSNPADAYDVPRDNPFVGTAGARSEIWAFGLRNPFRFSFDRQTGQLWMGDVGQNAWEEIDVVTRGGNYGWPRYEGSHLNPNRTDVQLAPGTQHVLPIHEYDRNAGAAIIGGYVYRGSRFGSLFGKYVYGDYMSGTIWSIDTDGQNETVLANSANPASFGEDNDGELYVVSQGAGRLFNLADGGGGGSQAVLLSQTGLFANLEDLTPAAGLIEYETNVPFWSDGAIKRRWVGIPQSAKVAFSPTGGWTFPNGTVTVKHFEMEMTEGDPNSRRRLETRVLTRNARGDWSGFVYKWNADQSDADLLVSGESESLSVNAADSGQITWPYTYPSRTDCLQCHTNAASFVLGISTRQLNRDYDYGRVVDNQLRALNHIGYFEVDAGAPAQYDAYPMLDDANASVARRARAYLAVNCAQCHRGPGSTAPVALDFRFDTSDAGSGAIDAVPTAGNLGLVNARIVARGSKERSVLWARMRSLDGTRMPPLGSHRTDEAAVELIGTWIDEM